MHVAFRLGMPTSSADVQQEHASWTLGFGVAPGGKRDENAQGLDRRSDHEPLLAPWLAYLGGDETAAVLGVLVVPFVCVYPFSYNGWSAGTGFAFMDGAV